MKALLIERPHVAHLVDLPTPELGDDGVLVRVAAVGICGSDVELLEGRRPLPYARYPIVPGHEWAGTIERVGRHAYGLAPDDRVVAEGFRNCGTCRQCRQGNTNLCEDEYAETGFTHQGACASISSGVEWAAGHAGRKAFSGRVVEGTGENAVDWQGLLSRVLADRLGGATPTSPQCEASVSFRRPAA